jgi:uncharacterized membrane protein
MRRDNTDLILAAVVTACTALVLLLTWLTAAGGPAIAVLRVLAGLPLVLLLPGYALSTLLPAESPVPGPGNRLLWRAMWAVGLSLTVTVLGGLLLNVTPAGLTRVSWTVSLAALTMLTLAVTALSRACRSRADMGSAERPRILPVPSARVRTAAAYALCALVMTGASVGLAEVSAGWRHSQGFVQLWLLPARDRTAGQATLGIRSAYPQAQAFHLLLRSGTRAVDTWDMTLAPGQTWQMAVPVSPGQHLTAQLTASGQHSAAQTVQITSSAPSAS